MTTDFGSVYPAIMEGVILQINPEATIVDVTGSVPPGQISRGAYVLRFASGSFPRGTIHLAVVDPGVGGPRRALVIRGEHYTFVGPDNGLLIPAARAQGRFKVYEIRDFEFYTKHVSPVFHGRDVFAPAAAYLSKGKEIPCLCEVDDPVDLDFGTPVLKDGKIHGKAIFVDDFGNVVTNIGGDVLIGLCRFGEQLEVNGIETTFVHTYCEAPKGSLITLVGSHGMVEIACNGDNAATITGILDNDPIVIMPIEGKTY